jgi:hypothetical protein
MIFIGEFFHLTNQEEIEERDRRHGEFNLIRAIAGFFLCVCWSLKIFLKPEH